MKQKELVKKIKEKKEFASLSDLVIEESVNKYTEKYRINLETLSEKEIKVIVKEVRAELRNLVGRFQTSSKNREKLLKEKAIEKLLKTHSSTAERLDYYPKLKKIIDSLKMKSILDLGCGLNPIALANKKIKYYASDIREDELELIKLFFKKNRIKGKTFCYDLRKINDNLPKADLCLLFKVLDIIDDKKHKISKKIIETIPCNQIIVSFSTKKLSGKKMNFPKRRWFEFLLERLNLKFKKFETDNEVFYLIDKSTISKY